MKNEIEFHPNDIKVTISKGRFFVHNDIKVTLPDSRYTIIPHGTETNFISVPYFFRMFISPIDKDLIEASVLHDALVGEFDDPTPIIRKTPYGDVSDGIMTWTEAKRAMIAYLELHDVSRFKIWKIRISLKVWGWLREFFD